MNKWLFAKCGWKRPNSSLGSHVRSFGQKVGNRDPAYRQQATPLVGMREQQLLGATLCRRPRAASLTRIGGHRLVASAMYRSNRLTSMIRFTRVLSVVMYPIGTGLWMVPNDPCQPGANGGSCHRCRRGLPVGHGRNGLCGGQPGTPDPGNLYRRPGKTWAELGPLGGAAKRNDGDTDSCSAVSGSAGRLAGTGRRRAGTGRGSGPRAGAAGARATAGSGSAAEAAQSGIRTGTVRGLQPTKVSRQQPEHRRPQYGGGLIDGIQLGHGLADVKIDRTLRDVEDFGDFAGGLALAGPA